MGVAEQLIQTSLLGEAAEYVPFAILVSDDEGRFVAVNQAACLLLGYSREELLELGETEIHAPGTDRLTHKDGTEVAGSSIAGPGSVAGMPVTVTVFSAASSS